MIGDLYIYSDNLNGDANIVDLSSNNFTITKIGMPYHSTSYTSTTPRFTSCIYCPRYVGFQYYTGITLGTDIDFTFDIYINNVLNSLFTKETFAQFGSIAFKIQESYIDPNTSNIAPDNRILLYDSSHVNYETDILISNAITYPCLITITRQGDVIRIFEDGVINNVVVNFDMANSDFQVYSEGASQTINTVRIVNGISLYNSDFAMPTFPYTDGESITGQVTESDIGVARTIRLYNRTTGELTYTTTSNVDGTYEIPILNNDVEYDVVFLDDTAGNTYNDIIQRTSLI